MASLDCSEIQVKTVGWSGDIIQNGEVHETEMKFQAKFSEAAVGKKQHEDDFGRRKKQDLWSENNNGKCELWD